MIGSYETVLDFNETDSLSAKYEQTPLLRGFFVSDYDEGFEPSGAAERHWVRQSRRERISNERSEPEGQSTWMYFVIPPVPIGGAFFIFDEDIAR